MSSVIYHRSIYGQFDVPLTLHLYTNKLQYIMYESTNTQHIIGLYMVISRSNIDTTAIYQYNQQKIDNESQQIKLKRGNTVAV